jgi:hypothetical protein
MRSLPIYTDVMTRRNSRTSVAAVLIGFAAFFAQTQAVHAATLTDVSVTSVEEIASSGTNATPVVVTATAVTGDPSNNFIVYLPVGWSFVTPSSVSPCEGSITVTGYTMQMCQSINTGSGGFAPLISTAIITAGTTVTVTFAANSLNVAGTREFDVTFVDTTRGNGTTVDAGSATLAGGDVPVDEDNDSETGGNNSLAETGLDFVTYAGAGLALVVAGIGATVVSRRRSRI